MAPKAAPFTTSLVSRGSGGTEAVPLSADVLTNIGTDGGDGCADGSTTDGNTNLGADIGAAHGCTTDGGTNLGTVTSFSVTVYGATACTAGALRATVAGVTVTSATCGGGCRCGNCDSCTAYSSTYANGIDAWSWGTAVSFSPTMTTGVACVSHFSLTVTYGDSETSPSSPPPAPPPGTRCIL